jgi:hypothetical protein
LVAGRDEPLKDLILLGVRFSIKEHSDVLGFDFLKKLFLLFDHEGSGGDEGDCSHQEHYRF